MKGYSEWGNLFSFVGGETMINPIFEWKKKEKEMREKKKNAIIHNTITMLLCELI